MRKSIEAFKTLGEDLTGVEIGVWYGENALSMLNNLPNLKLYLIDPYILYDEYNLMEISGNTDMDINYKRAVSAVSNYRDKCVFIIKKAHEAVNDVPDDLDFVYIDGNHNTNYLKTDMDDYYSKVKTGGILAGHDFQKPELRELIIKFSKDKKIDLWSFPFEEANHIHDWDTEWRLYTVPNDHISIDDEDWWVIKK